MSGTAVTAAAGVTGYALAASGAAQSSGPTAAANGYGAEETGGSRLAALGDIPPGGGLLLEEAAVVLTLNESGDVLVFSATCTHQGCTVTSIEDGVIVCRATTVASTSARPLRCPGRPERRCHVFPSRCAAKMSSPRREGLA